MLTLSAIGALLAGPLGWIAAALAGALGILAYGRRSKRTGRAEERQRVERAADRQAVKQATTRVDVEQEVDALPPDAVRDKLRHWSTPAAKPDLHRLETPPARKQRR